MWCKGFWLRVLCCIVCAVFCFADEIIPYAKQSVVLASDNDAYALQNRDQYYTAGHMLSYTGKEQAKIPFSFLPSQEISRFSIGLGQEIYTPKNFSRSPSDTDMLYAGYTYLNFALHNRSDTLLEIIGGEIGMVGPNSMAQQAQRLIHQAIGSPIPRGWSNQLKNEVVLNFSYRVMYRLRIVENHVEFLPFGEIMVGNAFIHGLVGFRIRAGTGLNADFGFPKVKNAAIGSTSISDSFRFYGVVGFNEKLVGRNMFIEGNTFGGVKSSLTLNRFVYEAEIGGLIGKNGYSIGYYWLYQQKEFSAQEKNFSYGSIRFEISF